MNVLLLNNNGNNKKNFIFFYKEREVQSLMTSMAQRKLKYADKNAHK